MKIIISHRGLLYCAALAAVLMFCAPSTASAETDTFVIQEQDVLSGTVVGNEIPSVRYGKAPAVAPFRGSRERLPAGTAVMGVDYSDANALPLVVSYASSVAKKTRNELVLNTTVSNLEDEYALNDLAGKVYRENGGQAYRNVTIFWFLGENPEPSQPWGRTDIVKGDMEYRVVRIER